MKKLILTTIFAVCITALGFGQSSVMDFYNAQAKAGQEGPAQLKYDLEIVKQNTANGYLEYTYDPPQGYLAGVISSPEQMAYFTSNNGKKFVAVVATSKNSEQDLGNSHPPQAYELSNGKLVDKTSTYFPMSLNNQIQSALDKGREKYAAVGSYIDLPEYGTTIKVGVWAKSQNEAGQIDVGELKYNVDNGTFTFVEK